MGKGNPGFRFQDKPYDPKETSAHLCYPTTVFLDYHEWDEDKSDSDNCDDSQMSFDDEMINLAHASGLPKVYGMKGEQDSECCMGYRDSATVIAEGEYCKLVAMDGDNSRIAFSCIPARTYEDVAEEIERDSDGIIRMDNEDTRSDEDVAAAVTKGWAEYMQHYTAEATAVGKAIHSSYPVEGTLSTRGGAWTSGSLPDYDESNHLTF